MRSQKTGEGRLLERCIWRVKRLSESPRQLLFNVPFNAFGELQADLIVCAFLYEGFVHANVVHQKRMIHIGM
jgi:hypothetical protein